MLPRAALPLLLAFGAACAAPAEAPPREEEMIDFKALVPGADLDIRYATANNFTKKVVYPAARCLLRRPVALKLAAAAREFEKRGYRLRVYDCYRPLSVQRRFWELVPDERYVADPKKGSRHNRGAAVDLDLTRLDGRPLEFPTAYDDFSEKAHRGWAGASEEAKKNSALLEGVMRRHGFKGLPTEWWHFDAAGWESYPLSDRPLAP